MPEFKPSADIFSLDASILVNPVNCQGVMGAGLARQFALRYPSILAPYKRACSTKQMVAGGVLMVTPDENPMVRVANLATKDHWKSPSQITWIESGVHNLAATLNEPSSIAIPQLGCGLGGLQWVDVLKAISPGVSALESMGHTVCLIGPDPSSSLLSS